MTFLPWSPLAVDKWDLPLTTETLSRFLRSPGPLKLVMRDDRIRPLILVNEAVEAVPGAAPRAGDIVVAQADWEIAVARAVAPVGDGRWEVQCDALEIPPALAVPVARVTRVFKHEGVVHLDSLRGRLARRVLAFLLTSPRALGLLLGAWALGWKLRHPLWPPLSLGPVQALLDTVVTAYSEPDVVKSFEEETDGFGPIENGLLRRLKPGARILDIGCGAGREAMTLARMGFRVTAIDISPGMIEALRRRAESHGLQTTLQVGDVVSLDLPPNSYDGAYVSPEVYSYIPGRQRRVEALRRIRAALREEGILLLLQSMDRRGLVSRSRLVDSLRRLGRPIFGDRLSEPGDGWTFETATRRYFKHRFFSSRELHSEIVEAGLRVEAVIEWVWVCRPR